MIELRNFGFVTSGWVSWWCKLVFAMGQMTVTGRRGLGEGEVYVLGLGGKFGPVTWIKNTGNVVYSPVFTLYLPPRNLRYCFPVIVDAIVPLLNNKQEINEVCINVLAEQEYHGTLTYSVIGIARNEAAEPTKFLKTYLLEDDDVDQYNDGYFKLKDHVTSLYQGFERYTFDTEKPWAGIEDGCFMATTSVRGVGCCGIKLENLPCENGYLLSMGTLAILIYQFFDQKDLPNAVYFLYLDGNKIKYNNDCIMLRGGIIRGYPINNQ